MHPFSLKKEETEQVSGGTASCDVSKVYGFTESGSVIGPIYEPGPNPISVHRHPEDGYLPIKASE